MSDRDFYSAAYDAAEAECKALKAENDRLREALMTALEHVNLARSTIRAALAKEEEGQ